MTILTAEQAKAISEKHNSERIVESILQRVESVAKRGDFETKIREYGFGDGPLYTGDPNETQIAVMERLIDLGYSAKIISECKQLVDIYLLVRWSE